jgi:hypothetical protein
MCWGSTQSHSLPRNQWRMCRIKARDVENVTCDNEDSSCSQVGYADKKREGEDDFVECS